MFKKFISTVAIFALSVGFTNVALGEATSGEIYSFEATQSSFNTYDENVEAELILTDNVYIEATVYTLDYLGGNEVVAVLEDGSDYFTTGSYDITWNGRINNRYYESYVGDGDYMIVVNAYENSNKTGWTDTDEALVTIDNEIITGSTGSGTSGPGSGDDDAEDFYIDLLVPTTVVPNYYSTFYFEMNENAYVTVEIEDRYGAVVKTFSQYDDDYKTAGTHSFNWNGLDDNNDYLDEGYYTVYIDAENSAGEVVYDDEDVYLESHITGGDDGNGSTPEELELELFDVPAVFSAGSDGLIRFRTNEDAYITIRVRAGSTSTSSIVKYFPGYFGTKVYSGDQTHTLSWDGTNNSGNEVTEGTYYFELIAESTDGVTLPREVESTFVDVVGGGNDDDDDDDDDDVDHDGDIEDFDIDPDDVWNPDDEDLEITVEFDGDADDVEIYAENKDNGDIEEIFDDNNYDDDYIHIFWDGDGIDEGDWWIVVEADGDEARLSVEVDYDEEDDDDDDTPRDGDITSFELDPDDTWDPTDEDLEGEVEFADDVEDVEVYARSLSTGKTIEIFEDSNFDDDELDFEWDGTDDDDDGDYARAGDWQIIVEADGDKVSKTIKIEYEEPVIDDIVVSKSTFDPREGESITVFVNIDNVGNDGGVLTAEVKGDEIVDEEEVGNGWFAFEWDGRDDDGDIFDEGSYKIELTLESEIDDDLKDEDTVTVKIKDADFSNRKANITDDYVYPALLDTDEDTANFHFCIDDEADITLDIFEKSSASGSEDAQPLDEEEFDDGCHTVTFDLEDDRGRGFREGIHSYKITSDPTGSGSKDTSTGKFIIARDGDFDDDDDDDRRDGDCSVAYLDMRQYDEDDELCHAVKWATETNMVHGYRDGTFRPKQAINRVEFLQVVEIAYTNAYGLTILPDDGTNLGHRDLIRGAWYMAFVRTGKFHGIVEGYIDGTFRPGRTVSRNEMWKMALETARAAGAPISIDFYDNGIDHNLDPNWDVIYADTTCNYGFSAYCDSSNLHLAGAVDRGEVVMYLYRMHEAGLL